MSLKPRILRRAFTPAETHLPRDLGDGLVLRTATGSDTEPLAQFNGHIHGRDHFDTMVAAWTRDYMSETHPAVGPDNVFIVEDTHVDKIVSTMCLIPQTWTYAGIPFGVGRVEAVGTDPEYRHRGLVRAQFEVLHARSAEMGHLIQGITGIPFYYRQFGYEYALNLSGGRLVPFANVTPLKPGEIDPYRLRPMTAADLSFAAPLYERELTHSLVACPRPEWLWQYWLSGCSSDSYGQPFQVIESAQGRAVGYVAPTPEMERDVYSILELVVMEGQSLRAVMPSVLRGLKVMAEAEAAKQNKTVKALFFRLGPEHPVYAAIPEKFSETRLRYGWYVRVPDVPAFIRQIAPALEHRLANSPVAGHTGEFKINFYTGGLRMAFENGRLITAESWEPGDDGEYRAGCPELVFLQMLFGFCSLAETRVVYPDCFAWGDEQVLFEILFPKQHSRVAAVW